MRSPRLFKRLDFKLSLIIGSIVGLWFISFLFTTQLLNKERAEKQAALEEERVITHVQGELTHILNDILLEHKEALSIAVQDLKGSLGLNFIELTTKMGDRFKLGEKPTDMSYYFEKVFPVSYDGIHYGTLTLLKEKPVTANVTVIDWRWITGIAIALSVIFGAIRVFISKQVIAPITGLLSELQPEYKTKLGGHTSSSIEIDQLGESIRTMKGSLINYQEKLVASEKQAALLGLASQVAHDIRSPLAALAMVNEDLPELPEEKRILVRSAVSRIHDIANSLLDKQQEGTLEISATSSSVEAPTIQLLSTLVDNVLSEKRSQYRSRLGVEIISSLDKHSYGVFAKLQPREFKRVLSNVINNSVEAIPGSGRVTITFSRERDFIILKVADNGMGIPADILPELMKKRGSFNKANGKGFGLFHAKETVEAWGGSITMESTEGIGTSVSIRLPQGTPPSWFVPEVRVQKGTTIVVLDDDLSIHHIWKRRFDAFQMELNGLTIRHLSTPEDLNKFYKANEATQALYLIDYELVGQKTTGLELIENLGIANQSILVTSRFEEGPILSQCERLRIPLIPKSMARHVPISITEKVEQVDTVLIDDEHINHLIWQNSANQKRKTLRAFTTPSEFWSWSNRCDTNTPIYVDACLANGERGEMVTRAISQAGFRNIYITTAYDANDFVGMPWIKGVIGKQPPWV